MMSQAAFRMNRQMTTLAMGSRMGKPSRAPPMPMRAPTEDRASLRWCQASAMRAGDWMRAALTLVYQNMASLVTMETMAAIRASPPGTDRSPYSPDRMVRRAPAPIPRPTRKRTTDRRMAPPSMMYPSTYLLATS